MAKNTPKPILTEAEIISDANLVERIKSAKPVGKPMTADEFIKWMASL